jgi:stage III sporulation protein SpoIIIAA
MQRRITDDLEALMKVIPIHVCERLRTLNRFDELLEVILDLGRVPTARYVDGEITLSETEVSHVDLDYVVSRIGAFDADNRAGMERTLHRISGIRNRRGQVVGLTCRVGRAVYGTIEIIEDIILSGKSILLLGAPGVGKTTLLREAARTLAEKKRVVIVDTSNEIGGDGDVPHPAVGRARRMQVAQPSLQHEVMIEAVENHNPEVIVIDEIGRQLEAEAARTIAERGVQLIGTAHGNTLENLLLNPTLSDLLGGIESVTLSDEEARRRGTQKTVLERRSPPTFDVLIEIQTRDQLAVHTDVAAAVDSLLRGYPMPPEIRMRDADGEIKIQQAAPPPVTARRPTHGVEGPRRNGGYQSNGPRGKTRESAQEKRAPQEKLDTVRVYPFGVARNRLSNAVKRMRVPADLVREIGDADVLVTLRTHYRKRQRTVVDAEHRGIPVYVLRANTISQMERFLGDVFNLATAFEDDDSVDEAVSDTQQAIQAVLNGERWVELAPASSYVRRLQHKMAQDSKLVSHSYGKEPNRRVRIFRE